LCLSGCVLAHPRQASPPTHTLALGPPALASWSVMCWVGRVRRVGRRRWVGSSSADSHHSPSHTCMHLFSCSQLLAHASNRQAS
jgi:hypothetical protein